jgi:hypothetical protein
MEFYQRIKKKKKDYEKNENCSCHSEDDLKILFMFFKLTGNLSSESDEQSAFLTAGISNVGKFSFFLIGKQNFFFKFRG